MTPRKRLALLATKLRELAAIPVEKQPILFDLNYFRLDSGSIEALIEEVGPEVMGEHTCGTVACAIGYATMIPELVADGFVFGPDLGLGPGEPRIRYHGESGWFAAEEFFDLQTSICRRLFDPSEYENVRAILPVAERIEAYLRGEDIGTYGD